MSLRLLLDEDTQSAALIAALRAAGHDVSSVTEARLEAAADEAVLAHASAAQRAVLTYNCGHFASLHRSVPGHYGILAVYRNREAAKDMTNQDIVRALANLDTSGVPLAGLFIALNEWQF